MAISCKKDHSIGTYHMSTLTPFVEVALSEQYPMPVRCSPSGKLLLAKTSTQNGFRLDVIDVRTRNIIATESGEDSQVSLTWSPTSSAVAMLVAHDGDRHFRLRVWRPRRGHSVAMNAPITSTAAPPIRWSRDGRYLAYYVGEQITAGQLVVVDTTKNESRFVLGDAAADASFAWSPNGQGIAAPTFADHGVIQLINMRTQIARRVRVASCAEVRDVAWGDDGKELLFTARAIGQDSRFVLYSLSLSTERVEKVTSAHGDIEGPLVLGPNAVVYTVRDEHTKSLVVTVRASGNNTVLGPSGEYVASTKRAKSGCTLFVVEQLPTGPPGVVSYSGAGFTRREVLYSAPTTRFPLERPEIIRVPCGNSRTTPCLLWRGRHSSENGVLIYLHGGPHLAVTADWDPLFALAVHFGYVVVAPNYQGSIGYGKRYESNSDEQTRISDIAAICRYGSQLTRPARPVVLFGSSYGAQLTAEVLTGLQREVRAAVIVSTPPLPTRYRRNLNTVNVTLFQGTQDHSCGAACAEKTLVGAFPTDGSAHSPTLRVFPNEGHLFSRLANWAEVYAAVLDALSASGRRNAN